MLTLFFNIFCLSAYLRIVHNYLVVTAVNMHHMEHLLIQLYPFYVPSFLQYQCSINLFPSYTYMYKDVRAAVDLCHRDGTLKQTVAKDPEQ